MSYKIRRAKEEDLPVILMIYEAARAFMAEIGNPAQWGTEHPRAEVLKEDIRKEQLYVITLGADIHGVFAFIIGEDPTYAEIEGGAWKSDLPYGTIHRIAGDGKEKGIFTACMTYCWEQCGHLRIDTHEKNVVMRHVIEKNGFEECGIIYVRGGSPRIAYER